VHVRTIEQVVDIFTKPLKTIVFRHLLNNLGIVEGTSLRGENVED